MDVRKNIQLILDAVNNVSSEVKKVSTDLNNLGTSAKQSGVSGKTMGLAFLKSQVIFAAISKVVNLAVDSIKSLVRTTFDLTKAAVQGAAQLQQTRLAIEVLTGSTETATKLLKDLSDFALKTPFELRELQTTTKQLLAFGFTAEEVIPILDTLGNISAAVGTENFPFLVKALGDVKINTELATEILNNSNIIDLDESAHIYEHSIEVQLPFLQYIYGSSFEFVPICFLMQDVDTCREVGLALAESLKDKNAVLIYHLLWDSYLKNKILLDLTANYEFIVFISNFPLGVVLRKASKPTSISCCLFSKNKL